MIKHFLTEMLKVQRCLERQICACINHINVEVYCFQNKVLHV